MLRTCYQSLTCFPHCIACIPVVYSYWPSYHHYCRQSNPPPTSALAVALYMHKIIMIKAEMGIGGLVKKLCWSQPEVNQGGSSVGVW